MAVTISKDRVEELWRDVTAVYLQYGQRMRFPEGTPPERTYQWRYLVKLAERLDEWGFDRDTTRRFLEIVVYYAREKKLLLKGLAIMCQSNLLDVCYKRLQQELDHTGEVIDHLRSSHQWVTTHSDGEPTTTLLYRPTRRAYCNLVKWYQQGHLSPLYLSLSRAARAALRQLATQWPADRQELPTAEALYLLRTQFMQDEHNRRRAQDILRGDWKQWRQP